MLPASLPAYRRTRTASSLQAPTTLCKVGYATVGEQVLPKDLDKLFFGDERRHQRKNKKAFWTHATPKEIFAVVAGSEIPVATHEQPEVLRIA